MKGIVMITKLTQREYDRIFAVSKDFARAIKAFSKNELKTLIYALSKINFRTEMELKMEIDKYELAEFLGFDLLSENLSQNLFSEIKEMPEHSKLQFRDKAKHVSFSGFLIDFVKRDRDKIIISFEKEAISYFSNLLDGNFIVMLTNDIRRMATSRAIALYEYLRLHSDTRKTNTCILSTEELKLIFKVPDEGKGSYTDANYHFQRTRFENQVLIPACEELSKCQLIKLVINNEHYYKKIKNRSFVKGYQFTWVIDELYFTSPNSNVSPITENMQIDFKTKLTEAEEESMLNDLFS